MKVAQDPALVDAFADTEDKESVATQKFTSGKARLEVLGVCKISEDSVSCWSAAGVKDPELTARVDKGLTAAPNSQKLTGSFVSRYKLKNRLIIVKSVAPVGVFDARINTWQFGDDPKSGEQVVAVTGVNDFVSNTEFVENTSCAMVATAKDAKTLSLKFAYVEPVKDSAQLPMKEGQQVTVDGVRYTLSGWKALPQSFWYVQVETDAKSLKGLNVGFTPLDAKGKVFEFVDDSGKPFSSEEYYKLSQEERVSYHTIATPQVLKVSNRFEIRVNIDPAHVGSLAIRGVHTKKGRIEGIALDPK